MKEKQVEHEILIANLQWNFRTNKAKVTPHFDEELPEAIQEPAMQFCLGVCLGEPEEFQCVAVAKDGESVGMSFSHHWRDFWRREGRALEKGGPDPPLQLALAPTLLTCHAHVELAFFRQFALAQNLKVV